MASNSKYYTEDVAYQPGDDDDPADEELLVDDDGLVVAPSDEVVNVDDDDCGSLVPTKPASKKKTTGLPPPVVIPWDTVWNDPRIEKVTDKETFKRFWVCGYCNVRFPTWNATKVKAHLAKKTGHGIQTCKGDIDFKDRRIYHLQWSQFLDKRKLAADTTENDLAMARMEAGVETMISRGSSLVASKVKHSIANQKKYANGSVSCIPFAFRLSDLSDDSETKKSTKTASKPFEQPRSQVQTLLTNKLHPNAAKATLDMNYLISCMIHEEGLPFSFAQSPCLKRVLQQARLMPIKYNCPDRHLIAGAYMDLLYEQRQKSNETKLKMDATIFGHGIYCDGATIKKKPVYNVMASNPHMPHAVLEIMDCSEHKAEGGHVDAKFVADLVGKHIDSLDPKKESVDIVLFDGAANVQKAGRILEARYSRVTCVHGAEHVISLFFSDFFKTEPGMLLTRLCKATNKWFGGTVHIPYAMFMRHSKNNNGGHQIGLIRVAETRMAGYAIALTRLVRHMTTFETLFADPAFKAWLKKEKNAPNDLVDFLKNQHFWKFLLLLLRSLHGAYLTLRHADQKSAGMDWLYFNACRVTTSLAANHAYLDQWDDMDPDLFINELIALYGGSKKFHDSDSSSEEEDEADVDDDDDGSEVVSILRPKLGTEIRGLWDKRLPKLCHDFAIVAWVLALDQRIREHVKSNLDFSHKQACERMLLKLFLPDNLNREEEALETTTMIDEFWDEYDQFDNRHGPAFGESRYFIWASLDISQYQSYKWHKKYSLIQTKQLGRLACRVTSKILGMGSAERCWGDVKKLKNGQRSHLSTAAASKAATIYGAACAERAALKKPPAHLAAVRHWEEADLDSLGLSRHGVDLELINSPSLEAKVFKCWSEDWEHEMLRDSDNVCEQKFLAKYGGLVFQDGETLYTAHREKMYFSKSRGNSHWMVLGCTDEYEPEAEYADDIRCFEMDDDFFGIVFEYYRVNPDPLVKIIPPPGALDEHGEWNLWIPDPKQSARPRKKSKKN
jgi:hypothetical protein